MNIHAYVHNDACYVTCLHLKGHNVDKRVMVNSLWDVVLM